MAIEKAKITFYRIDQAGFYQRGQDEPAFGNTAEMLAELHRWSQGKQLAETKTYEPAQDSDLLPVYLMGIEPAADSHLVTMWNQTPSVEGNFAAAMGNSQVGNTEVVLKEIPEGGIPGFATYFWFLPELGVFASIKFQHLITGQKPMQEYMESYLGLYSSHVVLTDPEDGVDIELVGYRQRPGAPVQDLSPRFRTSLLKKPGDHELLIEQADQIRKVHRKTTLHLDREPDLDFWQRALQVAHLRQAEVLPDDVRIKYELKVQLDGEQVGEIIDSWLAGHDREWDDYGFQMRGEQSPRWLSHSIARDEFDLDVTRDNLEVVNARSLLEALRGRRQAILEILR
ncbi:hypothetical protein [Pseudomonas citronellolis]|uniref:hypothetical protein n=1 Tax=Pseudomonas citronellolis TaxID=53408 RepID=UPI0008536129|nr:hypothetical protein [Pseudomonas humi]